MSYTAQLFESLLRASAEGGSAAPAVSAPAASSTPGKSLGDSSYSAEASSSALPHELDECYAVIKFQRTQIAQLRSRVTTLEEQNAELRESAASAHASVSNASAVASKVMGDEIAALRTTLQQQTEEIKRLRDERAALAKQVAEAEARVHSVRAAADREKQELAFKLGREAALAGIGSAGVSHAINASPFTATSEASESLLHPVASSENAATPQGKGAGRLGASAEGGASEEGDAAAAVSPSTLTNTAGTVSAASGAATTSGSTSLDASTASLLEKQEHVKQQEALLLALKQQQVVNRVLTAQQRLQQQRMGSMSSMGNMNMGGMGMMGSPAGPMATAGSFRSPSGVLPRHGTQMNMGGGMGGGYRSMTAMPSMMQPQQPPMSPHGHYGSMMGMGMGMPMGMGMGMQGDMQPVAGRGGSQRRLSPSASMGMMGPGSAGGAAGRRRQVARAAAPPPQLGGDGYYDDGADDGADDGYGNEQYPPQPSRGGGGSVGPRGGSDAGGGAGSDIVAVGFGPDGRPQVLPDPDTPVEMRESEFPPPGGYTIFRYPAPGSGKWPDYMLFFRPLVNNGIPILKHGRMGRPHPRLMWLDITDPDKPTLVWHEGTARDGGKVKEKDRLPLIDIIDIKAGRVSANLQRTGTEKDAGRYMSFNADGRTFDIELPTPECRDWLFKKFADLFQAYANAKMSGLTGDAVTELVLAQIDGQGIPPHRLAEEQAEAQAREQGQRTPGGRGRGASPRRGGSARAVTAATTPGGTGAGVGGRQRSRSPRGMQPSASMYY